MALNFIKISDNNLITTDNTDKNNIENLLLTCLEQNNIFLNYKWINTQ